jgi:hypothetical protein
VKKTRIVLGGLLALAAAFGLIQLIPVSRTNPPVTGDLDPPPPVKAILRATCYDCHSNETVWPWYSSVAPVSWLVAGDTAEGRQHLNFSTWNGNDAERRRRLATGIAREVREGDMPPWYYVIKHPAAKLTPEKRAALEAWAAAM